MTTQYSHGVVFEATNIPYVTADEAYGLLQTELERFLVLLETLEADDWTRPTACTLWNVRDIVAHQAGGYANGTGFVLKAKSIASSSNLPAPDAMSGAGQFHYSLVLL